MLSEEQQDVIDAVLNSNKIIAVNACSGSGKTTLSKGIVETIKPKKGFYTAFNRAIVQDSSNRFGNLIPCKTMHSLAYKYANTKRKQIKDLTYRDIDKGNLQYKLELIDTLDTFYRSKFITIDDFLDENKTIVDKEDLLDIADKMLNDEISPTFNFLLKKLHLMLVDNAINLEFDLLLFDEAQDSTAVMLEIFKLLKSDRKVILGDKYQNIYSFMDTVNAFEELDPSNLEIHPLTKSFRCRPEIAEMVEDYGRYALESQYVFKGNDELHSRGTNITHLCRYNSSLIVEMYKRLNIGKSFKLVRSVDSIFEFPIAMYNAGHNKPVKNKIYTYLEDLYIESKVEKYIDYLLYIINIAEVDDTTENCAYMLYDLEDSGIDILDIYNAACNRQIDNTYTLSTVHTYKGLENDNIELNDDITIAANRARKDYLGMKPERFRKCITKEQKEHLNIKYVALSRARYSLEGAYV